MHGKKHQNTVEKTPGKAQKIPPAKSPKDTRKSTTKNTGKPHQKKHGGHIRMHQKYHQIKTQKIIVLPQDDSTPGVESLEICVYTVYPIGSMYGIFTYIWLIFKVNVCKYTIQGSYGI